MAGSDRYFHSLFQILQNKTILIATRGTVGMAEWIIDDTCFVDNYIHECSHVVHLSPSEIQKKNIKTY